MNGNCEHALKCPNCRPVMPADVRSLIFDPTSWNIFVGTLACGGSIMLGSLIRCFSYAVVYSSVSGGTI